VKRWKQKCLLASPNEAMMCVPNVITTSRAIHTFVMKLLTVMFFKCLSDTFRQGMDIHKFAFEAVCVTFQYQMDDGSPIYTV
jgi:hypothetical protein